MVVRKQTIWLMTMVSLIIVLGVYYITAPDQVAQDEMTDEEMESEAAVSEDAWVEWLEDENTEIIFDETFEDGEESNTSDIEIEQSMDESSPNISEGSSMFSALRIERQESRDQMRESYDEIITDGEASATEKSEAFEKKEELQKMTEMESRLENLIQAEGYKDVVVMSEEDRVKIIVQADELSKAEVVQINRLADENLNIRDVAVGFHAN